MQFDPAKIREAFEQNGRNVSHTAAALGLDRGTVRKYLNPLLAPRLPPPLAPTTDTLPLDQRQKIAYEDRIAQLRKELKAALREDISTESIRTAIFGLCAEADKTEIPEWSLPVTTGGEQHLEIPMTHWSDWHWGEVVSAEEIGGVNEYNLTIAQERVQRLVAKVIELCFNHMVNPNYPGLVLCLGGDMLGGEIHEELAQTNETTVPQALLDLYSVLIRALTTLADRFGRLWVYAVPGNHGRMTKKPTAKRRVYTNFDWLLYTMLERYFAGDSRLSFRIPPSGDAHFRVYGKRFFLTHGDALGVKGGDGIIGALGPIARGVIKTRSSEAQVGRDFDVAILGHWHQYLPLSWVIVNSSLKGYDEFARTFLRARCEPPSQSLWFVHPRHGIICHWPVYVSGDDPRLGEDAPARVTGDVVA